MYTHIYFLFYMGWGVHPEEVENLCGVEALYLHGVLAALFLEVVKLHDLSHDEALLEVSVDLPGSLGRLGAFLWSTTERGIRDIVDQLSFAGI